MDCKLKLLNWTAQFSNPFHLKHTAKNALAEIMMLSHSIVEDGSEDCSNNNNRWSLAVRMVGRAVFWRVQEFETAEAAMQAGNEHYEREVLAMLDSVLETQPDVEPPTMSPRDARAAWDIVQQAIEEQMYDGETPNLNRTRMVSAKLGAKTIATQVCIDAMLNAVNWSQFPKVQKE